MTASDVLAAEIVSPSVAARRASGVRSGRALTAYELDSIRALGLDAKGATNVGDLTSYQTSLLGIGALKGWEEQAIADAEDRAAGAYDPIFMEVEPRRAAAARGGA